MSVIVQYFVLGDNKIRKKKRKSCNRKPVLKKHSIKLNPLFVSFCHIWNSTNFEFAIKERDKLAKTFLTGKPSFNTHN